MFDIDEGFFEEQFPTYADFLDTVDVELQDIRLELGGLMVWVVIRDKDAAATTCRTANSTASYVGSKNRELMRKENVSVADGRYILKAMFEKRVLPRLTAFAKTEKEVSDKELEALMKKFWAEYLKVLFISAAYQGVQGSTARDKSAPLPEEKPWVEPAIKLDGPSKPAADKEPVIELDGPAEPKY